MTTSGRTFFIAESTAFASDLQKSRWFYEDFLGYAEPYNLKRDDGSVRIAFIKINEDQYIELLTASVT
jgi:catechol 2,3-dioxygenase-like lactoylglutathione lyase family enzyme